MRRAEAPDFARWTAGELDLDDLEARHPGFSGLVGVHEQLVASASQPVTGVEAGWAALMPRLRVLTAPRPSTPDANSDGSTSCTTTS